MVGVAQLVERRVVASVVVGSSPITHPILNRKGCGHLTVVFFFGLQPSTVTIFRHILSIHAHLSYEYSSFMHICYLNNLNYYCL